MARGRRCPVCRGPMYARDERYQRQGTWVTYQCRSGSCPTFAKHRHPEMVKVFEPNR